jgi:hypothetical protein
VVFSGTPVSSTNKTDSHDIPEILLKVALNTITLTLTLFEFNTEKKSLVKLRKRRQIGTDCLGSVNLTAIRPLPRRPLNSNNLNDYYVNNNKQTEGWFDIYLYYHLVSN